jgi:hypothetical protein
MVLCLGLITCWLCDFLVSLTMHQTTRRHISIDTDIQGKLERDAIYFGT